jgi:hypothetical protein
MHVQMGATPLSATGLAAEIGKFLGGNGLDHPVLSVWLNRLLQTWLSV